MSRDYRAADVFSAGTRPLPLWLWLFAVLAVGGFVFLIYYLDQYEKSKTGGQETQVTAPAVSGSSDEKKEKASDSGTDFSFYKLLPNISVDVPKNKNDQRESAGTAGEMQSSSPAHRYILQVGSFKDFKEADKLKARLAFLGIQVNIEKVTLNTSDVWHRVRVGPIQSEREMNKIRNQLRQQQIEPIMLKVKG